jgi:hypothetical protein
MTDVIRRYSLEETARRRDQKNNTVAVPFVGKVFAAHPRLQSAVLLVGQFWADEAYDAVHAELLYSISPSPDLAAFARETAEISRLEEKKKISIDEADERLSWYRAFVDGPAAAEALGLNADRLFDFQESAWLPGWDSNDEMISLFAAFCTENASQEMPVAEAYAPYAIFRRAGDGGAAVEIVGKNIRPWLDGVRPEEGKEPSPPGAGGEARGDASLARSLGALIRRIFVQRR